VSAIDDAAAGRSTDRRGSSHPEQPTQAPTQQQVTKAVKKLASGIREGRLKRDDLRQMAGIKTGRGATTLILLERVGEVGWTGSTIRSSQGHDFGRSAHRSPSRIASPPAAVVAAISGVAPLVPDLHRLEFLAAATADSQPDVAHLAVDQPQFHPGRLFGDSDGIRRFCRRKSPLLVYLSDQCSPLSAAHQGCSKPDLSEAATPYRGVSFKA
jgi:hypothetical protein